MLRHARFEDIEACPDCGLPVITVDVDHPTDAYTVREHILLGTYGSAIKGKRACPPP